MTYHTPVLVHETMEWLNIKNGMRYIDATFGGGGHAREIAKRNGVVLGIDTDQDAIEQARYGSQTSLRVVQGNFRDLEVIAKRESFYPVAGVLFDLGVSSHQLDERARGFSYRFPDSPFDLRLNQIEGKSASDIVNHETKAYLEAIIRTYGEEEHSGLIADSIVRSRLKKEIRTTGDILDSIKDSVGEKEKYAVASRVFQAFRIEVNDELHALKAGLEQAVRITQVGGRIAVISFHSLEDRIVKQFFLKSGMRVLTKKPISASETERRNNIRSRSAKLRVAERI